jgi:[ribosomal protein S5]-alanine N-acetyltransferase
MSHADTQAGTLEVATPRMRLVALDAGLMRLQIDDREAFFKALDVVHEAAWPPELNNLEAMPHALAALEADPAETGWQSWAFIMSWSMGVTGRLAGLGGFHGQPGADGSVEIGYAMLPSFREQGLATEAVDGLAGWAFTDPRVTRILARTVQSQEASRRVLEKTGFSETGRETPENREPTIIHTRPRQAA